MKIFVVLFAVASAMATSAHARSISDSLVKDLACESLTRDNVLNSLQEDAFSVGRQNPIQNWSAGMLAECWSLAHAQRLTYYLGRFNETSNAKSDLDAINMFRGAIPVTAYDRKYYGRTTERDAPLVVFGITENESSQFFRRLWSGVTDQNGERRVLKDDIEAYQSARFSNPGNLRMLTGDRERPGNVNAETFVGLQQNVARNRMPLIVIRVAKDVQHVVLIKRIDPQNDGSYVMTVYDSNMPRQETPMYYSPATQQFYAPQSVRWWTNTPDAPIGVFSVDDDDMDSIQNTLYQYYRKKCSF